MIREKKMLKNLKKTVFIISILFLTACGMNVSDDSSGVVTLNINMSNFSRTIMYDLSVDMVNSLEIVFISGPAALENKSFEYDEQIQINLPAGDWEFEIYGININSERIVFAEASIPVSANEPVTADILLKPMMNDNSSASATGSAAVTLNWSACSDSIASEIAGVETFLNGTDVSEDVTVNFTSGYAEYVLEPCPSGNYIIDFGLFNTEELLISTASEAFNVRDNLDTNGSILLNDEDFNLSGVTVNIIIDLPEDEVITFNYTNGYTFSEIDLSAGVTIEVTSSEVYESYAWSLYGYTLASDSDSVELPADLIPGVYHLTVYVEKNGNLYSETLRFLVED